MTARSAIRVLRDAAARSAVIRQYASDFDRHAEDEQLARLSGNERDEQAAHTASVVLFRAWRAELDDPEVKTV